MERTAATVVQSGVRSGVFDGLTHVDTCVAAGHRSPLSAKEVAAVLNSGLRVSRRDSPHDHRLEVTCISLTLIEEITARILDHRLTAESTSYWEEVLKLISTDLDLMDPLVGYFQSEDPIISHLAAKSASTCVFYDLLKKGRVSPLWLEGFVRAFDRSDQGAELDAFLWSLKEVLKKLVKGEHGELLQQLEEALDCSLRALCLKLLPQQRKEAGPRPEEGPTLCLLLEVLEVLSVCGGQGLLSAHSSGLLEAVTGSAHYPVKRKAMLLLKRAVLLRLGEDWAGPELWRSRSGRGQRAVAHSVLRTVDSGWLDRLDVGVASYFGGSVPVGNGEEPEADGVMVRAVSLTLLKAVELLTAGAGAGVVGACGYLRSLWGFLRRSHGGWAELSHGCCWIGLLFGEQDDDMMEAALLTLSMVLNHRSSSLLVGSCSLGSNPHCHFVLLLRSISFDPSILLDFLISTETCFLEYLTRYLKFLTTDWQGFSAACGRLSAGHQEPGAAGEPELSSGLGGAPVKSQRGLVDYPSSEESDSESEQAEPVTHVTTETPIRALMSEWEEPRAVTLADTDLVCETRTKVLVCLSQLWEVVTRLHAKKLFPYNPSSLLKLLPHASPSSHQSHYPHH